MLASIAPFLYEFAVKVLRMTYPQWHARSWSNSELSRWGKLFSGNIINVSGWDDRDKEGNCYQDYFPHKACYTISNIKGSRGWSGNENEIFLDLTEELPQNFKKQYDVVFNHTTLEHIFDIRRAMANLCELSRDIVIVVVPFLQVVHHEPGSFSDYWRPTPFALESMFRENGLEMLYCSSNDTPIFSVYLFCIASRFPDKWSSFFPPRVEVTPGMSWHNRKIPKSLNKL